MTSNYEDIASVTAPDDYTVVIKLKEYCANMLGYFTIGILPKHLLGKSYMLQGIPGTTINKDGIPNPIPTYSQFTVVGTENGTSVSVSPRVNMVCRSRGDSLIHAGQLYQTSIQENEVLLFQPENYNHDISGTVVESDKAVAVFQGNNVTNYPSGIVTDYVWEQARPTDAWGKEFIVAGTGQLMEKGFAIKGSASASAGVSASVGLYGCNYAKRVSFLNTYLDFLGDLVAPSAAICTPSATPSTTAKAIRRWLRFCRWTTWPPRRTGG